MVRELSVLSASPSARSWWVLVTLHLFMQLLATDGAGHGGSNEWMEVRSGRDLAIALATSPRTNTAVLFADVWMSEPDWDGLLEGPNGSAPVVLNHNFTIMGSPSLPNWPLLNLGVVRAKIRIGSGVTLVVQHVVVGDFRSGVLTQAPGFDLAAPSPAGAQPGVLMHNETAVLYNLCFPRPVWASSMSSAQRALSLPGNQTFQLGMPQDGCVDATANSPPVAGLVVQPPMLSRCWADKGVFTNLAVPGADVDPRNGVLVANNYDVLLLGVTYMCLNVMPTECIGRLGPLGCATSMSQNSSAAMPWRLPTGPAAEMQVRSGRDLAVAFASAPWVTTMILMTDIWMRDEDWDGLLGGPNGSEPALLSRNFTILGSPSLPSWPLLNMAFVPSKVRIASGVALIVKHVVVGDFRSGLITQAPGFDLAAATRINSYDSKSGLLLHNETAVLYGVCFPKAVWNSSISTAPRSVLLPGNQTFELSLPQDGCINITAGSPLNAPADGLLMQPPMLSRCWADRGIFTDLVVIGSDVGPNGVLTPSRYDTALQNVTYMCLNVMPMECIGRLGPLGCAMLLTKNASQQMPWRVQPQALLLPTPAAGMPAGGDCDKKNVQAAALGGALGGAALLALIAVGVYFYLSRRGRGRGLVKSGTVALSDPENGEIAVGLGDGKQARKDLEVASGHPCFPLAFFQPARISSQPATAASTDSANMHLASRSGGGSGFGGGGGNSALGMEGGGGHVGREVGASPQDTKDGGVTGSEGQGRAGATTASASDQLSNPTSRSDENASRPTGQQHASHILAEDEHVVVTPLTPQRADLAVGEAAAREVTLLPVVRGKGAFGRVYEGLYGGERVAVKVMRDMGDMGAASTESVRLSFAQEVEVLGRCCHPNVVRLLAACVQPPKMLLVMELMEGSLEKLVYSKTAGLMPLTKVLYIALDIARGLEYLHPTILHRDLKPANILINDPTGVRPIAKITDFGVSRLRSTVLVTKHPEAGTPAYMAPETFDVKNYTLSHHVDVYSFGVVLWVMLKGEHPWQGLTMLEVAYKVTIRRERLEVADIPEERCPPKLRTLMEQCWEHEPRRRPAAAEIVKELQFLLEAMQPSSQA